MKYKLIITALCLQVLCNMVFAQNARFLNSGVITYEKKVNAFAILDLMKPENESDNIFFSKIAEAYKNNKPKFFTTTCELKFNSKSSLFETINSSNNEENTYFLRGIGFVNTKNKTYTQFQKDSLWSVKHIFGETIGVKDSLKKIKWKITPETREIAGYTCRRANGLILDSIYVVAFYTDNILPSGGPESFHGLPGMILGVSLPHLHVSWFATKVEDHETQVTPLEFPKKTKIVNDKELQKLIKEKLDWGNPKQTLLRKVSNLL